MMRLPCRHFKCECVCVCVGFFFSLPRRWKESLTLHLPLHPCVLCVFICGYVNVMPLYLHLGPPQLSSSWLVLFRSATARALNFHGCYLFLACSSSIFLHSFPSIFALALPFHSFASFSKPYLFLISWFLLSFHPSHPPSPPSLMFTQHEWCWRRA